MNLEQSLESKQSGAAALMSEAWQELQSSTAVSGVSRAFGWKEMAYAHLMIADNAAQGGDAELLTDALLLAAVALSHASDACGESLRDPLSLLQCAAA